MTGVRTLGLALLGALALTFPARPAAATPDAAERGDALDDPPPPPPPLPPPSYLEASSAAKPGMLSLEPEPLAPLTDEGIVQGRSHAALGYEIFGGTVGYIAGLTPLYTSSPDAAIVTLPLGIALGVWIAGAAAGGDGDFSAVLVGELVGIMIAAPFALAGLMCTRDCELALTVGLASALVFPIGGAVLGYEMSNDEADNEPP